MGLMKKKDLSEIELKRKKQAYNCNIYVSQRKGKLWSEAKMLQLQVDSGSIVGHPSVTADENMIFFSSDQPGGLGGKDIWVVQKIEVTFYEECV